MSMVYISGPISNTNDAPARFAAAEAQLSDLGYRVANPITLGLNLQAHLGREPTCEEYLRADMATLLKCDFVAALLGWKASPGARRELAIAKWTGIPAKLIDDFRKCVKV